eukprot:1483059-Prymnesium_polylepis.1
MSRTRTRCRADLMDHEGADYVEHAQYPEAAEEAQADRRGVGRVDREERVDDEALDLDQCYHLS